MKYKIITYIKAEDYSPHYFESITEAQDELDNLEMMNPCCDNYYVIEEVDGVSDLIPFDPDLENTVSTNVAKDYNPNDPANW